MFKTLSRLLGRPGTSPTVLASGTTNSSMSSFSMMSSAVDLPPGKYPAKKHAQRVVEYIRSKHPHATGVLYLEARATKLIEDNDEPEPFRQRRYFHYLTGCKLADSCFVYDMSTGKSTLFIPPIDPESVIWSGLPMSTKQALEKYDVDEVKFTNEINPFLAHVGAQAPRMATAFAIANQVSGHVTFLEFGNKNFDLLKEAIETCRVVKDDHEVSLLRKANEVSMLAHHAVFQAVKGATNEAGLQATFVGKCMEQGANEMSYHPILASGRAAATLHYVKNNAPLEGKLNLLIDAGAEWDCYCADITRTFPLSGEFSPESRNIYDLVLKMQTDCIAILKADVVWETVHELAHKIAIDGLLSLGILKGDKEEILRKRVSVAFFPHGLGHYLGLDTHDTGGNANYEDKDTMFRYLRVRGKVPAQSVVTVEPGIYFCNFIIEPFLEDEGLSQYIDKDVLEKYWDVGGVRLEDNILITEDGCENLTDVVKDPGEVERMICAA